MSSLIKDESILETISALRARLGGHAFELSDEWEADLCAIGLTAANAPGYLVYISTSGTTPGRYFVSLELPPTPGNELPYTPGEDMPDVGLAELTEVVRRHLRLE